MRCYIVGRMLKIFNRRGRLEMTRRDRAEKLGE